MSKPAVTATRGRAILVEDDYLDLIHRFPLRPIRNDKEYSIASRILDEFIGREDLTSGQRDYIEGLVRFCEDYERERLQAGRQRLTPLELLRHLMEENNMTTTDLGYILGSRGLASEVLNGKRGLSKTLIGKISSRFRVDPGMFLEVPGNSAGLH